MFRKISRNPKDNQIDFDGRFVIVPLHCLLWLQLYLPPLRTLCFVFVGNVQSWTLGTGGSRKTRTRGEKLPTAQRAEPGSVGIDASSPQGLRLYDPAGHSRICATGSPNCTRAALSTALVVSGNQSKRTKTIPGTDRKAVAIQVWGTLGGSGKKANRPFGSRWKICSGGSTGRRLFDADTSVGWRPYQYCYASIQWTLFDWANHEERQRSERCCSCGTIFAAADFANYE